MIKKDLSIYKRKYQAFRHHAWAGLGFLSVLLAVRIIFPEPSKILTYKYRAGLSVGEKVVQVQPPIEVEKELIRANVEKERLKLEKKKAKDEIKAKKKSK